MLYGQDKYLSTDDEAFPSYTEKAHLYHHVVFCSPYCVVFDRQGRLERAQSSLRDRASSRRSGGLCARYVFGKASSCFSFSFFPISELVNPTVPCPIIIILSCLLAFPLPFSLGLWTGFYGMIPSYCCPLRVVPADLSTMEILLACRITFWHGSFIVCP